MKDKEKKRGEKEGKRREGRRERGREREEEKPLSFGSLPKCQQQLVLGQATAMD